MTFVTIISSTPQVLEQSLFLFFERRKGHVASYLMGNGPSSSNSSWRAAVLRLQHTKSGSFSIPSLLIDVIFFLLFSGKGASRVVTGGQKKQRRRGFPGFSTFKKPSKKVLSRLFVGKKSVSRLQFAGQHTHRTASNRTERSGNEVKSCSRCFKGHGDT